MTLFKKTLPFFLVLPALLLHDSVFCYGESSREKVGSLMALPYLQGYFKAPERANVVKYNRQLSHKGYNLYSSGHAAAACLIDMKGETMHQWAYDMEKVWPDMSKQGIAPFWENVYLYENGDLLALTHDGGLIKLDKDSRLLWSYDCHAHHDIDVDEEGNIYILTSETIPLKDDAPIIDNSIRILSPEGKLRQKLSLLQLMHKAKNPAVEPFLKRVVGIALSGGEDVFHTNTLQVLDGKSTSPAPLIFNKGNILISMLTLSAIAVIDPKSEEFVWIFGPRLWIDGQHNSTLLDNGHIMTFDNHYGGKKTQSRVVEFEPLSKKIIWEYTGPEFYTDTQGSQQRLENGNTLIVESNTGRAFEVTPDKKIVWEFLNPHTTGKDNDLIAAIYVLRRIDPADVSSWLNPETIKGE